MRATLQTDAQRRADRRAALADERDLLAHKLHLARVRLDPVGAARREKAAQAKRARELRDPNHGHIRFFPSWTDQGATQYIRTFQALNRKLDANKDLYFVNINGKAFL